MSDDDTTPDQFLYKRKGPWPQPSPAHPMSEANEVLNIPPIETLLWNSTIGQRYLMAQVAYPPVAAEHAVKKLGYTTPSDADFNAYMLIGAYQRFLQVPSSADDRKVIKAHPSLQIVLKYDFSAMELVQPDKGFYCAPTVVYFSKLTEWPPQCVAISVAGVLIQPDDTAWDLAKIYALQGASYHTLFVIHPAIHFPLDSINAVTKTAVPQTHPLFQLIYPHTSYTLALDNAVQESDQSVVNNSAAGTWFDPLTAGGYNLKKLFGAGYSGLPGTPYAQAYPVYDYMTPSMLAPGDSLPPGKPSLSTPYSKFLSGYFHGAFLPFCSVVAAEILAATPPGQTDKYVKRWADYLHPLVKGFPDGTEIFTGTRLAEVLAIYLWSVTVSHGADHYSFSEGVPAVAKFLRIRRPPPASPKDKRVAAGEIFTGDDLYRAEMAQCMFFKPWAIEPNLSQTRYAFLNPKLAQAQQDFQNSLNSVSQQLPPFMPLDAPPDSEQYSATIPASIQY